ncbi:MAG: hypothetical protein KAZ63_05815, partial [Vitreoscilla sp.]|nr:hypothetical protein [Vitreoscilla sp.]
MATEGDGSNSSHAYRLRSPTRFSQDLALFAVFERLIDPYPDAVPPPAPRCPWPSIWANTRGVRRYV